MARVLPLTVFGVSYFYYPNNFDISALEMYCCKGIDKKGVLRHEYSQSAIGLLHAPHFRRVVLPLYNSTPCTVTIYIRLHVCMYIKRGRFYNFTYDTCLAVQEMSAPDCPLTR